MLAEMLALGLLKKKTIPLQKTYNRISEQVPVRLLCMHDLFQSKSKVVISNLGQFCAKIIKTIL